MKKQGVLILMVLFVGTMGWQVGLAEEKTAKPLPSDEEFLAPFSLEVQEAFFELSQEERDAIRSKKWGKDEIAEVIKLKDDFLRKYRLGMDEVQKFFRAEEKRKEPMRKPQRERLKRLSVSKGNPIKYVINKDCVLIGTVKEIQEHPEGPYHTWVVVEVEQYLKGGSGQKEVIIKIIYGPVEFRGEIGEVSSTGAPKFVEGERVLLTLGSLARRLHAHIMAGADSYRPDVPPKTQLDSVRLAFYGPGTHFAPDSPYRRVKICEGYFEFRGKWTITEDNKIGSTPLEDIVEGIRFVLEGGTHEKQK